MHDIHLKSNQNVIEKSHLKKKQKTPYHLKAIIGQLSTPTCLSIENVHFFFFFFFDIIENVLELVLYICHLYYKIYRTIN